MQPDANTPTDGPIFEAWRIAALVLVVAVGMLIVHVIVAQETAVSGTVPSLSNPR